MNMRERERRQKATEEIQITAGKYWYQKRNRTGDNHCDDNNRTEAVWWKRNANEGNHSIREGREKPDSLWGELAVLHGP